MPDTNYEEIVIGKTTYQVTYSYASDTSATNANANATDTNPPPQLGQLLEALLVKKALHSLHSLSTLGTTNHPDTNPLPGDRATEMATEMEPHHGNR